jgi:hypothetical protein
MDTEALYERLDTLAGALERDGGTHGTDELVSLLTDVLGLVQDGLPVRHSRTPALVWTLDPGRRADARGTVLRWLRDAGHIPPPEDIR